MQENKPWTRKHEPKKTGDILGQDDAVSSLLEFARNFKKQKRKAVIIYGPVGSGKTVSVYAIGNELGLEIIEVNASDFRNKEGVESTIGAAAKQQSLFSKGKLILVDEIEGLSGMQDRGGITALASLIEESGFPIICTSIDPFDKKFSPLRKKSKMVEFRKLDHLEVFSALKNICGKEGIRFEEEDLKNLARRTGGDMRAAINDLQMLSQPKKRLEKNDVYELSQREQTESIMNAVMKVLKTTDFQIAISAFENLDEDNDEIFLWLDENMPKEYDKPEDLARAYDYLSKADVMKRRIRRWQHWRFLVYVSAYLSAGVAVSKDEKYQKFVEYKPTSRLLKIWMANQKYMKRKAIAEKIAEKTHSSARKALQDTLPYVQVIFNRNKQAGEQLSQYLDLDEEESEWMGK